MNLYKESIWSRATTSAL